MLLFVSLLGSYATLSAYTYPRSSVERDIMFEDLSFKGVRHPIWYVRLMGASQIILFETAKSSQFL